MLTYNLCPQASISFSSSLNLLSEEDNKADKIPCEDDMERALGRLKKEEEELITPDSE